MKKIKLTKETLILSLILILSVILNFTNLSIDGYANQYYAAGVKSMTMSLKNFFFVSFDPAGFVTIDKPPLGFWIQAISAKIFGFSGWSIILPQALAGVISVGIIYFIVKRTFGSIAGLISALCLAVTPVFVAVSRNNTCDNLLVLTLLLACWALSIAAEKGKLKYLIISLAIVGIGFNIKMLQAYMIAPALYITYLLSNAVSIKKRITHLALGTVVLLLVSFSWAFIVDLVPAENRPFVGSSTNNTVKELIFGHNGLERLGIGSTSTPGGRNQGKDGEGPGQFREGTDASSGTTKGQLAQGTPGEPPSDNSQGQGMHEGTYDGDGQGMLGDHPNGDNQERGQGTMGPGPGGNNMGKPNGGGRGGTFGGDEEAGITRLFSNNSLSDQIIWLLPLAIFGFAAAAIKEKFNLPFNNKRKLSLILWSMWLLPEFIYFSYTKGLFHPYYLTMLAAPIAALTGIGIVSMWQLHKEGGWKSWILPAALIADGLVQTLILSYYYSTSNIAKIIMIVLAVLCFLSSAILIFINLIKNKELSSEGANIKLKKMLLSTALVGLLVAPLVWSSTTMFYGMSGTFPSAGLGLISNKGMNNFNIGMGNSNTDTTTKLVEFLKANTTNEKYLVAVPSATGYASDIIIKTGESVMTLGGFSGSDNILTLAQFKQLVSDGVVRYAIINGGGPGGNNEITNWIQENGRAVSESEWADSTKLNSENDNSSNNDKNSSQIENQKGGRFDRGNSVQLYDLKPNASISVEN
ncbi:dolichyl-phosphate-mannose-protein mannosyltransferase [Clostridium polyendosporum]|uniref:Dolichyl-phosphate-mannose-protein mannosyltransferase n=1 Tax=Clostridium polyendosporum TaxID=69208 RepID=A0A919VH28_9CLOT|nr:glycosyltransferase family 39 protein [Clostridium polyendosporum]GIM29251.1 dolichyl-phosphate-mannose-protein mannosyltransferase [Clostridium polyendosporum]